MIYYEVECIIIQMLQCIKNDYFCLSGLYCCVHSSNNFWFISMNSLSALYISPCIVL